MKFTPILNFAIVVHLSSFLLFTHSRLFPPEHTLETIVTGTHHLQLQSPAWQVAGQRVPESWAGRGWHQPGPQSQRSWRGRDRVLRCLAAQDPQLQGSAASPVGNQWPKGNFLFSLFLLIIANIEDIPVRKNPYLLTSPCTFDLKRSCPQI